MRTATLVVLAYLMAVVVASLWRFMPTSVIRDGVPDLAALTAAYLGLTARRDAAPAVGGSVAIGYLADIISGTPAGLGALVCALTCLVARATQQRLLVRGTSMTVGFSAFVALIAGIASLLVRVFYGMPRPSLATDLQHLAFVMIMTALIGPLVWRVFRRIDAAFARTHREKDAALEGLAP